MAGNKAKSILIAGYYGFGNVGDEAILSVMLADFRQRRNDLEFIVVSGNPAETTAKYDILAVHWQDIDSLLDAARTSDLIILGGGGLFQDHWGVPRGASLTPFHWGISFYSGIGMLAALYQKPFMIYSVGVGPLASEEGKRLTRWTFDRADICTVRDQESKDLLIALGIPEEKVEVSPDPVLTFSPDSPPVTDILRAHGIDPAVPLLGVSLRNWAEGDEAKRWQSQVAAALDQFVETHNAHLMFLPFQVQERVLENDHLAALDIVSMMQNRDRVTLLTESYSPLMVRGLISHCQLIVGMRLHSVIFAATTGVPPIALVYDPKLGHFMNSLGLSEYAIDLLSLTAEQLLKRLDTAWQQQAFLRQTLQTRVQTLRNLALNTSTLALGLLESRPTPPDSLQVVQEIAVQQTRLLARKEQELRAITSQLETKEREEEILKSQVNEMIKSKAWKLAQRVRQLRTSLLPINSHRERFARLIYHFSRRLMAKGEAPIRRDDLQASDISTKIQQDSADLQSILGLHPDALGVVIFPPTVGWNISLFQRPHQLARAFAKKGFLVFFCTESSLDDLAELKQVGQRLYLVNPSGVMLEAIEQPITFALPYNSDYLSHLRQPQVVYEVIDDLDVFPGDKALLQKNHNALLKQAHVVVVTADKLMEQVRPIRPDAILCPNAVDWEHFSQARTSESKSMPADLGPILKPNRPVIGYYGALARWFDYDLVFQAAQRHTDWDFLLIGPNHDNTLMASNLLSLPNIHWLGTRDYSNLPDYLRYFTVATIPFVINNITLATSPIKLFEYMAAGKPIVTTDMRECRKYPGVLVGRTTEEFIDHLERALTLATDTNYLQQLSQIAQENTWEARTEQILHALKTHQTNEFP